jgi:hypothetical protein
MVFAIIVAGALGSAITAVPLIMAVLIWSVRFIGKQRKEMASKRPQNRRVADVDEQLTEKDAEG